MTHLTLSLLFLSTERIDESYSETGREAVEERSTMICPLICIINVITSVLLVR